MGFYPKTALETRAVSLISSDVFVTLTYYIVLILPFLYAVLQY